MVKTSLMVSWSKIFFNSLGIFLELDIDESCEEINDKKKRADEEE